MRKRSILKTAIAVLIVVTMLSQVVFASAFDKSQQVYVSGLGHIDTAWQWPYATTISSYIKSTFTDMLARYDNNPGFVFNSSSPVHYKWTAEYYPDLLESIKTRVASGQWDIVGGQWVEPEGETVSGEAQVRQFLLGQQYYNDTFGEVADMGFLPDTPGHLWMMPQIFAKSGIKMWTGMRMNGFAGTTAYDGSQTYTGGSYSTTWWRNTNNTYGGDTFMWEGPDGTRILTVRPSNHYNNSLTASNTNQSMQVNLNELGLTKSLYYGGSGDMGGGVSQTMINNVNNANASDSSPAVKFAKISDFYNALTPEEIETITDTHLWDTELYYNHEHGLLLTHGEFKKYNNDTQIALDTAERLSSIAAWLGASEYPQEKIDFAWEKLLTAQQHDVIAGCNTANNWPEVYNDWEIGLSYAGASTDNAMAALASRADTTHSDNSLIPVLVFNSLGFERTEAVEADVTFADDAEDYVKVYDGATEIPAQIVEKNGKTAKIVFVAKVPSVGYKVFHVENSSTPGVGNTVAASSADGITTIDSALFKVELDDINGNINQVYDKSNDGAKSFSQPMELQLLFDSPGNANQTGLDLYPGERYFGFNTDEGWDEWIVKYGQMIREVGIGAETAGDDTWQDKKIGPDYRDSTVLNQGAVAGRTGNMSGSNIVRVPVNVTTSLIEQGPVRAVYKITKTFRDGTSYRPTSSSLTANSHTSTGMTTIEQYVAVYHEIDRVDLSFHVDWRTSRRMLKAAFYFENPNEYATFDLTYGTIARPNMNKFRSMVAGHKWADMTAEDGSYGVSIISENKYSWDKPTPKYLDNSASLLTGTALEATLNPNYREDVLRLDLLRSTKTGVGGATVDMGHHYFDIGLYPHSGTWNDAGTPQESDSLTKPLVATQVPQQKGTLGNEFSFVAVSADDVEIVALKKAQTSDDIIIRLYESVAKDNVNTTVTFTGPILAVEEINLTELENLGAVTINEDGKSFTTTMNHYELKTFRVTMAYDHAGYNDTKPVSNKIDLSGNYNLPAATTDSNRTAGAFDSNGNSYSADLWPETITSEGVTFDLGPKSDSNVILSVGQNLSLAGAAAGTHSVYFLASAVSGPKTGLFRVWYTDGTYEEKLIKISNWNGNHNLWNEGDPSVAKNTDRLAYTFTHHHSLSSDRYYLYAYMYMYGLKTDPEKTVESLSLPTDLGIRVFAVSTVTGGFTQLEDNADSEVPVPTEYTEIDDRHSAVKYIGGGWSQYAGTTIGSDSSRQNTRTLNYSAATDGSAAVEFTFTGTRVQLISEQGYNKGNFTVYINDEPAGAAHCFGGAGSADDNMACNFVAFDSGAMPKDTYKIKIVPLSNGTTNNWYCLDAFLVWDYEEAVEYPAPPALDPSMLDDADEKVTFTGEWTHLGHEGNTEEAPSAYANTLSVTNTPGAKVSIDFAGKGFAIFAQTDAKPAIVKVRLDGQLWTTLILMGDVTQHFRNVYNINTLLADRHTLEMELVSGTLRFDAVMIDDNPGGTDLWIWVDNGVRTTTNEMEKLQFSTGTGTWEHWTSGRGTSYAGTLSGVNNRSAWAEFRFTGEAVKVIVLGNQGHTTDTRVQIWDLGDGTTGDGTEIFNQAGYTHRLPVGASAEAGQQAAFTKDDLPFGNYRIRMTNNTSSNSWFTIDAFAYIPTKATSALVGYVYDIKTGLPLAGAKVEVVGTPEKYGITDNNGRYEFFADPGTVSLKVTYDKYYDETVTDVVVVQDKYTFVNDIKMKKVVSLQDLVTITSPVSKIVAGYAANIPADVTFEGDAFEFELGLYNGDGVLLDTISVSADGRYTFKLDKAEAEAGVYAVKAVGADDGYSIDCVAQPDNLWIPDVTVFEKTVTITFASEVTFNASKKGAKIDGAVIDGGKISASGKVVTITEVTAAEGQSLVISGIKYADLFPSYSFTFTLTI